MMADETNWVAEWYTSGTAIVKHRTIAGAHLSFHGPRDDVDDDNKDGFTLACQVRDWFNGTAPRPKWLDDMVRVAEHRLEGVDGTTIEACGPFYDHNPPRLDWRTRMDLDAKTQRAALIQKLV